MVHVSRTFAVDKPVAVIVDYLKDFANAEQWDPGTQTCTRVGSGPIEAGATWRNVSKVLGRETELSYRLDKLDGGHIVFVGTNKTATSTDDITVVARGSGSTITYSATIEFNGLAKIAGPLMKIEFERLGTKTEQQLSRAIAGL